jgi:hypothetical protein
MAQSKIEGAMAVDSSAVLGLIPRSTIEAPLPNRLHSSMQTRRKGGYDVLHQSREFADELKQRLSFHNAQLV